MTSFPVSAQITAVVDLTVGTLHVVASDRDDVVVTILPTNPGKAADARTAQDTTVEFANDVLTVQGPRSVKQYLMGARGTVDATIELPTGSTLTGKVWAGSLYTEGRLASVDVTVSAGSARIDEAGRLGLRASAGSVVVGRVTGPTDVRAAAGSVRVREVVGDAVVKSSNGDTTIGSVTGSLTVSGAHGEIIIGRVRGTVNAKASSGGIRVDSIDAGSLTLATSYGSVEVGVPEGTAAWLDASSKYGNVRNLLEPSDAPVDEGNAVEVHATTSYGDVIVRRPESTSPFTSTGV
ncbi:DUF4097 family beta strand repeat-containing protein [Xylanimonas sp. McL0601]|uniref:DUF4097 family beta strand repeat-containing protein n=1 Tax=Xylanimonas sp. McL0601 TaxID=3414739 RepID=UPI003CFB57D2